MGACVLGCACARMCVSVSSSEVRKVGEWKCLPRTLWRIGKGGSSGTSGTDQQAISFIPELRGLLPPLLIEAIVHLH